MFLELNREKNLSNSLFFKILSDYTGLKNILKILGRNF